MKKGLRILLILVALVSFGIALSYPIRYRLEENSTENTLERLSAIRNAALEAALEAEGSPEATAEAQSPASAEADPDVNSAPEAPASAGEAQANAGGEQPEAVGTSGAVTPAEEDEVKVAAQTGEESAVTEVPQAEREDESESAGTDPVPARAEPSSPVAVVPRGTQSPDAGDETPGEAHEADSTDAPSASPTPSPTPVPTPTIDRWERNGAIPYPDKEKATLDVEAILPEYREIYEMNHDFVGWLTIPGMNVDYPVVQAEDSEYYLKHDFFGESNANGQIILDTKCDPYTPSYNMVISGHNMRSGKMFGNLPNYASKSFWQKNKFVQFDTLMERKKYVIVAAFYSADYDTDEEGFRYNADIQYALDLKTWMRDIKKSQIYDTGIECEFGDEFLTLTTCNYQRRNGRFVVICRKVRDGEEFED